MCIASAISLLMILICGMATYGAYKVNFPIHPDSQKKKRLQIKTKCDNDSLDVFGQAARVGIRESSSVCSCNLSAFQTNY